MELPNLSQMNQIVDEYKQSFSAESKEDIEVFEAFLAYIIPLLPPPEQAKILAYSPLIKDFVNTRIKRQVEANNEKNFIPFPTYFYLLESKKRKVFQKLEEFKKNFPLLAGQPNKEKDNILLIDLRRKIYALDCAERDEKKYHDRYNYDGSYLAQREKAKEDQKTFKEAIVCLYLKFHKVDIEARICDFILNEDCEAMLEREEKKLTITIPNENPSPEVLKSLSTSLSILQGLKNLNLK